MSILSVILTPPLFNMYLDYLKNNLKIADKILEVLRDNNYDCQTKDKYKTCLNIK
ncbi:hypothetical protein JCM16358_25500 [Halanaerocella petrolearia]